MTDVRKVMNIALWTRTTQAGLALVFGLLGSILISVAAHPDSPQIRRIGADPGVVLTVGMSIMMGALGLVVPAVTRIKPVLTAWAGVLFTFVAGLPLVFHRMQPQAVVAFVVLGGLSAFVAWGRFKAAPIAPK